MSTRDGGWISSLALTRHAVVLRRGRRAESALCEAEQKIDTLASVLEDQQDLATASARRRRLASSSIAEEEEEEGGRTRGQRRREAAVRIQAIERGKQVRRRRRRDAAAASKESRLVEHSRGVRPYAREWDAQQLHGSATAIQSRQRQRMARAKARRLAQQKQQEQQQVRDLLDNTFRAHCMRIESSECDKGVRFAIASSRCAAGRPGSGFRSSRQI